jgi:hypothetical protein
VRTNNYHTTPCNNPQDHNVISIAAEVWHQCYRIVRNDRLVAQVIITTITSSVLARYTIVFRLLSNQISSAPSLSNTASQNKHEMRSKLNIFTAKQNHNNGCTKTETKRVKLSPYIPGRQYRWVEV